jgi:CRISPR/Cas system-associated protein endoribonuclease Cas2
MNIFVLDRDPNKAAQYHNNTHVRKMLLEGYQMLSTVIWMKDMTFAESAYANGTLYWPSHYNHRCTRWVEKSYDNFRWMHELVQALSREFTFRHPEDKVHKSFIRCSPTVNMWEESCIKDDGICWEQEGLTDFALAMPPRYYKNNDDPVEAYRTYYRECKRFTKAGWDMAKWTKRGEPYWWKEKTSLYVKKDS